MNAGGMRLCDYCHSTFEKEETVYRVDTRSRSGHKRDACARCVKGAAVSSALAKAQPERSRERV